MKAALIGVVAVLLSVEVAAAQQDDARMPEGPNREHVVRQIDGAVRTVRRIARWLGDQSRLWYDYGCRKENLNYGLAWKMP